MKHPVVIAMVSHGGFCHRIIAYDCPPEAGIHQFQLPGKRWQIPAKLMWRKPGHGIHSINSRVVVAKRLGHHDERIADTTTYKVIPPASHRG
jgi:hypothetical protein